MTPRVTVGIVALACVSVFGVVASLINFEMMDKVNEKLSEREQFTALGWYFSKYQRLHREYERLYPDGRLRLKFGVVTNADVYLSSYLRLVLWILRTVSVLVNQA